MSFQTREATIGKRSSFARVDRDFYQTPAEAVAPLLPHLPEGCAFAEPCAGAGDLAQHLERAGHRCVWLFDVEPQAAPVKPFDAFDMRLLPSGLPDFIITNPPWVRDILHRMIPIFATQRPTWLLFDADWVHTRQAAPFLPFLRKIVSVGRVKWIPGSKMTGKDNCAWMLFDAAQSGPIEFVGRLSPAHVLPPAVMAVSRGNSGAGVAARPGLSGGDA